MTFDPLVMFGITRTHSILTLNIHKTLEFIYFHL